MALTAKLERFCHEYVIDLNGTQAAIRAGYSQKTAGQIAEQNLKKLEVQQFIQELQKDKLQRVKITADAVIDEIAKIAFFDIRNIFNKDDTLKNVNSLDDRTATAISSIKTRIEKQGPDKEDWAEIKEYKTNDKLKALELLAKHLGVLDKNGIPKEDELTTTKRVTIVRRSN